VNEPTKERSRWMGIHRFRPVQPPRVEPVDVPCRERVTIILPVLNEAQRIGPCLESLSRQPVEVAEILVVDGGSVDQTKEIVARHVQLDQRIRWIDAAPSDPAWTGKAWGLYIGLESSNPSSAWILCVDADICASPHLVRSLLHHGERTGVSCFSVATQQRLTGPFEGLIHPALLTTLIYRFGQPGRATKDIHKVIANGQCFVSRRELLLRTGALRAAQSSLCEDITIARRLAECGEWVGFYEGPGLVNVRMYDNWRETWRNWPRSLPMRDPYFGWREWLSLVQALSFQALPLPGFLICVVMTRASWLTFVAGTFLLVRIGILLGAARAYEVKPWTYWLSPLVDLPVAIKLLVSALARTHVWRGRTYVRQADGRFAPITDRGAGRAEESAAIRRRNIEKL
jgi:dolichol-phosphate mannosyltransferase